MALFPLLSLSPFLFLSYSFFSLSPLVRPARGVRGVLCVMSCAWCPARGVVYEWVVAW